MISWSLDHRHPIASSSYVLLDIEGFFFVFILRFMMDLITNFDILRKVFFQLIHHLSHIDPQLYLQRNSYKNKSIASLSFSLHYHESGFIRSLFYYFRLVFMKYLYAHLFDFLLFYDNVQSGDLLYQHSSEESHELFQAHHL